MLPKSVRTTLTTLHSVLFIGSLFMILTFTGVTAHASESLAKLISFFLWALIIGTPLVTGFGAALTWKQRKGKTKTARLAQISLAWLLLHVFLTIWLFGFAIESTTNPQGNRALDWLLSAYAIALFPMLCATCLYLLTPSRKKDE